MDNDVTTFAQVMVVIVVSVASFVAIGFGGLMLWRFGTRPALPPEPVRDDERMRRLETAVDAIAIEVERISEGQRFVVGLLSQSAGGRKPELRAGRVDTPH